MAEIGAWRCTSVGGGGGSGESSSTSFWVVTVRQPGRLSRNPEWRRGSPQCRHIDRRPFLGAGSASRWPFAKRRLPLRPRWYGRVGSCSRFFRIRGASRDFSDHRCARRLAGAPKDAHIAWAMGVSSASRANAAPSCAQCSVAIGEGHSMHGRQPGRA